MKITIEVPDWWVKQNEDVINERHFRGFFGIEEFVRKLKGQPFQIKMIRCSLCGKCCSGCDDLEERPGYKQPNGELAMMCSRNEDRPQSCANNDGFPEDCQIKWVESGIIHIE